MQAKTTTKRVLRPAVAVALAAALVAVPTAAASAAPTPPPTTAQPLRAATCGTWLLHQVSSVAQLDRDAAAIDAALAEPSTIGFSVRVPWNAIDTDLSLLDAAYAKAQARGKQISVRFMAGRYTPSRIFDAGAYNFTSSAGQRVPKPFSDTGVGGNPVFEREFDALTARLATWSRAHGAKLLHLAWYGFNWSEIYNDTEVQAARGYTPAGWTTGHKTLIDIAKKYSGPDLAVEFPLSGYWGGNANLSNDLTNHVIAKWGEWSDQIFLQGNGLGMYNGKVTQRPIWTAKQMFGVGDWDWQAAYDVLYAQAEQYVEVYLSSFSGTNKAQLRSEAAQFDSTVCAPMRAVKPPPPPPPPPPPGTAPTTPAALHVAFNSRSMFAVTWYPSSDDKAVAGYKVSVDGKPYKTVFWTNAWVFGTVASTAYSVSVVAYDADGNTSVPATISVKTPA